MSQPDLPWVLAVPLEMVEKIEVFGRWLALWPLHLVLLVDALDCLSRQEGVSRPLMDLLLP